MEVKIPSQLPDFSRKTTHKLEDLDNENFEVYSSSDEDSPDGKKEWEPAPDKMVELFTQISNGQIPELTWKCPGRREPSVDGDFDDDIEENDYLIEETEKPTEFDFDSISAEPSQPYGQRKTTGTLKVQQKRVARLDKILDDMKKDTSFTLQSPRIPYNQSRVDKSVPSSIPAPNLLMTPAKGDGIPLPSAYTLTSPQTVITATKPLEMTDETVASSSQAIDDSQQEDINTDNSNS